MSVNAKQLVDRLTSFKSERSVWTSVIDDAIKYATPSQLRSDGIATPGSNKTAAIYDSTAIYGCLTLAAGIFGMLFTGKWFALKCSDKDANEEYGVRQELTIQTEIMQSKLLESNFGMRMLQVLMNLVSVGVACISAEKGIATTLNFKSYHISGYYFAENKDGEPDTVFREFTYNVRQAVQEFGIENVSEGIRKKYDEGKFEETFQFLHAVYPREDYDTDKLDNLNMPWASIYIDIKETTIVRESGYKEFLYAVPRWMKPDGQTMGSSPTMKAMSEIKMCDQMAYSIIRAGQKANDPTLNAPAYMEGKVRNQPRGVNYYRAGSRDRVEAVKQGSDFNISLELKKESMSLIDNFFFVNQFLALSRITKQMTILEVNERRREGMRLLSPMLEPLIKELADPIIPRVYALCKREGAFGRIDEDENLIDVPEALKGREITVEYTSSMELSLKMEEVQSFASAMEMLGALLQAPGAIDNIDVDDAIRGTLERSGAPSSFIREWETVVEMRKARQEAAQQAEQAERVAQVADITQKLSGKVDPSSPLKEMSDNPEALAGIVQ